MMDLPVIKLIELDRLGRVAEVFAITALAVGSANYPQLQDGFVEQSQPPLQSASTLQPQVPFTHA